MTEVLKNKILIISQTVFKSLSVSQNHRKTENYLKFSFSFLCYFNMVLSADSFHLRAYLHSSKFPFGIAASSTTYSISILLIFMGKQANIINRGTIFFPKSPG